MQEELESSNFFSNGNFKESSKDFLIKESKNSSQRHLWMAYCAIKSTKYIKELKYQK